MDGRVATITTTTTTKHDGDGDGDATAAKGGAPLLRVAPPGVREAAVPPLAGRHGAHHGSARATQRAARPLHEGLAHVPGLSLQCNVQGKVMKRNET